MFKVKDIMVSAVVSVRPEMPVYEAIRLMVNRNITGLPVVDEQLNIVGVLSEKDVLQLLYDTEIHADRPVGDYMSTDPITYDLDDSLIDVCDGLLDHTIRRVPVTCHGKLTGIVSRLDLIRAILKIKHQEAAGETVGSASHGDAHVP